jgi:NAD(P)-dependent dehydrogenase (short-subunit alcohol dehydrogenase family)
MSGVVAITGASAGIGRAVVAEFAKEGWAIGLIARGRDGLAGAQREVEALGGSAIPIETDVADSDAVEHAAERIERELGPIDVWINVAFTNVFSPFHELTPEEYRRITDVSYMGYVYGTMAALRRMRARNRGTIVQVGSALAYRSIPLQAAYCGAKSAIRGFTDSIRCELIHDKSDVRITMALMPAVNTPQFAWCKSRMPREAQPVPPIFQPEVAGRAVHWLALHPKRRELVIGFPTFQAVLGTKIVPGLLDIYLGKTGYDAQQHGGAHDPDAPNNLYQPLPGDRGSHGTFDSTSVDISRYTWLTENRAWIFGVAAAGIALTFAYFCSSNHAE